MKDAGDEGIAFLVAQYPAINHAVILREIRELRKFFVIRTASIRSCDRPKEQLSEEEREELAQTFYVKQAGLSAFLVALLELVCTRPLRLAKAALFAVKSAGFDVRKTVKNCAYLAEAMVLGRWMRRQQLRRLHVHYSSTVGLFMARVFPIELSISLHGPDEFSDPVGFCLRDKIEACTFVRAISHYARGLLMANSPVEQWHKIEVAYMGVDPAMWSPHIFREHPDPVEIISVGRLAPVKGQQILIAAVANLVREGRKVLLHVVGSGPERNRLEYEVEARRLGGHVIFHGSKRPDELHRLYSASDMFVLTSFAEGLPGVLMEAMAMAMPCVSSWITGVPELLRDGIDGLLVPPGDECAVTAAIARLIDDPELRRRMGASARRRVQDKFDLRKNACHLASVLARYAGNGHEEEREAMRKLE